MMIMMPEVMGYRSVPCNTLTWSTSIMEARIAEMEWLLQSHPPVQPPQPTLSACNELTCIPPSQQHQKAHVHEARCVKVSQYPHSFDHNWYEIKTVTQAACLLFSNHRNPPHPLQTPYTYGYVNDRLSSLLWAICNANPKAAIHHFIGDGRRHSEERRSRQPPLTV